MQTEFLNPLLIRWRNLQPRERALILVALGFVVIVALYLALSHMHQQLVHLRVQVPQERIQLALMQVQALQVRQLRESLPTRKTSGNSLARLEQTAVARGLRKNITRMEPDSNTRIRVSLNEVDFNALLKWLSDLQEKSGLRVDTATLEAQATAGIVDARILLHTAGE